MTSFVEAPWAERQAMPAINYPAPYHEAAWADREQVVGKVRGSNELFQTIDLYTQAPPRHDFTAQLRTLQKDYTIVDSDRDVMELLEEHASLFPLLVQAVQPLKSAFGERLFHIRVQHSDYDSLLKIAVRLPDDFVEPETALRSFDTNWWINNCQRSSGALVFDYEIQDAV